MLKAAAKDCEKLPNELKVDCYKVRYVFVCKKAISTGIKYASPYLVWMLRPDSLTEISPGSLATHRATAVAGMLSLRDK